MQIENEVKYKIKNKELIKNRLAVLNFSFIKKMSQEDYYFSPPHKKFAGTKKYYLRLRRKNKNAKFAYHVVMNNLQTKEVETQIDDFNSFLKILKSLDFKIDCIVKKERSVYKNKNIEIDLDKIKNLGNFIEIEYIGKMNNGIQKKFQELIKVLQLKPQDKISGVGYPDLLSKKNN